MSEHPGWVLALPLDLAIFLHSEQKKVPRTFFGQDLSSPYICLSVWKAYCT